MTNHLKLAELVEQLEPDAVRVLERIAERLLVGQRAYGRLDVATDTRDWKKEANEEALDLSVYLAIATLPK